MLLTIVIAFNDFILSLIGLPTSEQCGSKFLKWLKSHYFAQWIFWIVLGVFCVAIQGPQYKDKKFFTFIFVIVYFLALILFIYDIDDFLRFMKKDNEYFRATGVTKEDIKKDKGAQGEYNAYLLSQMCNVPHKTLYNVCVPMPNGIYQEIDSIIITKGVIYVVEAKNRGGEFKGKFRGDKWAQVIGSQVNECENIYLQNEKHISALDSYLQSLGIVTAWDTVYVSVVLTGGGCKLDMEDECPSNFLFGDMTYIKPNFKINEKSYKDQYGEACGSDYIDKVYNTLLPYALFFKEQRANMLRERTRRYNDGEIKSTQYLYFEFPNGIPGEIEGGLTLRQNNLYTQWSPNGEVWYLLPGIKYAGENEGEGDVSKLRRCEITPYWQDTNQIVKPVLQARINSFLSSPADKVTTYNKYACIVLAVLVVVMIIAM